MVNIYCDESCHLEFDKAKVMIVGAIKCDNDCKANIYNDIRMIKEKHNLSTWTEIKWTGVSMSKIEFYLELVDYFIKNDNLDFRAVIIKNKENLNHEKYNHGDHNLWYYKTYYYLLDPLIDYGFEYKIFIDIKDTRGGPRVDKLREVLCNNKYDFMQEVIEGIYQIRSNESEILELTDLLIGALGYYHNGYYNAAGSNQGKNAILDKLIGEYGNKIKYGNNRGAQKVDVFLWELKGESK